MGLFRKKWHTHSPEDRANFTERYAMTMVNAHSAGEKWPTEKEEALALVHHALKTHGLKANDREAAEIHVAASLRTGELVYERMSPQEQAEVNARMGGKG
ncbi:MAG: hypothetical protein CME06_01150 [Gemmatimonadetes bacterium]|jgi:hypothetical protein|nr:hypothetical protein [Gemmatimonadota bacterium]